MSTYSCANKNADGSTRQHFLYYRCPSHAAGACGMRRQINQRVLEQELLQILDCNAQGYRLRRQKAPPPSPADESARILAKIDRLKDLYLNDLIPRSLYEKEYATLLPLLRRAKSEKEETPAALALPSRFSEGYRMLSDERKKAVWSRTVMRIEVGSDGAAEVCFR